MRIENVAYKIYTYEELSKEAKEKAFHDFCCDDDYPWGEDNKTTLEEFEKIFPICNVNWEYGNRVYFNMDMDADTEIKELSGIRLLKYLWNNYSNKLYKGKYYSTKGYYDLNKKYHYKYRYSKVIKDTSCVLTGYYMDDIILDPIYKFMSNPSENITFYDLMQKCLNSWVNACNEDFDSYYSEENFKELCEANEWEFLSDGKMY